MINKTATRIIKAVAAVYGVPEMLIHSERRAGRFSEPRQMCFLFLQPSFTLQNIAYYFSRKQHGTILYGINNIKNLIETDEKTRRRAEKVKDLLDVERWSPGNEYSRVGKCSIFHYNGRGD